MDQDNYVLVADSRGRHLDVKNKWAVGGANMRKILEMVRQLVSPRSEMTRRYGRRIKRIIVFAGICDITQKKGKKIDLNKRSVEECFTVIDDIDKLCRSRGFEVVFATVLPVCLHDANGRRGSLASYKRHQATLMERVASFNKYVISINKRNRKRSPLLHKAVMKRGRGVTWSKYTDGVHFNRDTAAKITKQIKFVSSLADIQVST